MLFKTWIICHRVLVRSTIIAMLTCFMMAVAFFVWVSTGPRSLNSLTPYIKSQLNGMSKHFNIDVENSFIYWDSSKHSIHIGTSNVSILDQHNKTIATFPEIRFNVNWLKIFSGQLISSEVTIVNPVIYLSTTTRGLYITPAQNFNAKSSIALGAIVQEFMTSKRENFDITKLNIQQGTIYIDNGITNIAWYLPKGEILLNKDTTTNINNLRTNLEIVFGESSKTHLSITAVGLGDESINLTASVKELPSFVINDLFPDEEWANISSFVINCSLRTTIQPNAQTIAPFDFHIFDSHGIVFLPELFPEDLALNHVMSKGTFYPEDGEISVQTLNVNLDDDGPTIRLQGNAQQNTDANLGDVSKLALDVVIENLDMSKLNLYWPKTASPKLRNWVTTRITKGMISRANGTFLIDEQDIQLIKEHAHIARNNPTKLHTLRPPKTDMVNAGIQLNNAHIIYDRRLPYARNVDAVLHFDSNTMTASISHADILDSSIDNTHLTIDHLWSAKPDLSLNAQIHGPAANLPHLVKPLTKPAFHELHAMQSFSNITGNSSGHFSINFPLHYEHIKAEDVTFSGQFELSQTTLPKLIKDFDLSDASLNVSVDLDHLNATGSGMLNNTFIDGSVESYFNLSKTNRPFDHHIVANLKTTVEKLNSFKFFNIPNLTGTVAVSNDITILNDATTVKTSADLTQSKLEIPQLNIVKDIGKNAKLDAHLTDNKSSLHLSDFSLRGDAIDIKGNAILEKKDGNIILNYLDIKPFKISRQNNQLHYQKDTQGITLKTTGKSFDLSNTNLDILLPDSNKLSTNHKLNIDIDLDTLYLKNDIVFNQVNGVVDCSNDTCSIIQIGADLSEGKLSVIQHEINQQNPSEKTIKITSDNAGDVLAAFDILSHIKGGTLDALLTTNETSSQHFVTEGNLNIYKFKATKAPLLGKVLTLASFKGFTDLVKQDGISFDKFKAPLRYEDRILTITDATTSGSSIGITANGTINTNTKILDIEGVVVPASELNSLIGKIPLVGDLLTGGKNEGLIATNYSIKGTYEEAEVSVNPLSILTPSYLRKIFRIFD